MPYTSDGDISHAFALLNCPQRGRIIFDSNDPHPLMYSENAMRFCTIGFRHIQFAIIIHFKSFPTTVSEVQNPKKAKKKG